NDPGDVVETGLPALRDSEQLRFGIGSVFEISRLLQGEISVGYQETRYDSVFFNDVDGIDLDVGLSWFATQLTTVRLRGGSSIEDSTIPGSSGYLNYYAQLTAEHELRRNILLDGTISYSEDDYDGIPLEDQRFGADIGLQYLLNRNVAATVNYTYLDRDSSTAGRGYTQNIVFLGVRGQM
ncbi:MAG: outer membrane beta-barrel protein, partial [Pseudomonadota bacterium]